MKNPPFKILLPVFFFLCVYACAPATKPIEAPPLPLSISPPSALEDCGIQDHILIEARHLYKEEKYKKALGRLSQILSAPCSRENYAEALETIGHIFIHKKEIEDAFLFYEKAYENLPDEKDKKRICEKMAAIMALKTPDQIFSLIFIIKPTDLQGNILYKTGVKKFKAGMDKEALAILKKYIENFKNQAQVPHAESIIQTIRDRYAFHPNRIGVLLPLTGYYNMAGKRALNGLNLAIEVVNRSPPNAFHLIIKDTQSDPQTAVKGVKELAAQKAACIIGPMVTAGPAGTESDKLEIPMFTLTQRPGIPQAGPYIFRNWFTPRMQVETGIRYLTQTLDLSRFAVLYPDDKYGMAFKTAFEEIVPYYDGIVTDAVPYNPGDTDFSNPIKSLIHGYRTRNEKGIFIDVKDNAPKERNKIYKAKINFEVLFIPDSPATVGMLAPQIRYYGIDRIIFMGTNLWHSDKLLEQAGNYIQKAIFPDGFDRENAPPRVQGFISAFRKSTGQFPGYIAATAYDTGLLVMNALSLPYVRSKKSLVSALQSTRFKNGVTCPVSFDDSGEPRNDLDLYQVRDDHFYLIKSCTDDGG